MARGPLSPRTLHRRALYGWPQPGPGVDATDFPQHEAWPARQQVRIGTSGWSYPHWRGRFYPADLPQPRLLGFASRRLPTIEVNMTYRRMPAPDVFDAWREAVPEGFLFSVKAPRTITHDARLEDAATPLRQFLRDAWRLRETLGLVLFQLPPSLHADHGLLSRFLDLLPAGPRYAFELRHPSWFTRDTYMLLADHAAGFVIHDFGRHGSPIVETAPFIYLRLHGPTGRYRGTYDTTTLLAWATKTQEWRERGFEIFTYLNNDERANATRDARQLRDLISSEVAPAGATSKRNRARSGEPPREISGERP